MDIKLDEGFQFGLGAFETIAVEEGRPILLDRHLRRLERAAAFFGFGPASVRGVTEEAVHKFIADQSERGNTARSGKGRSFRRKRALSDARQSIYRRKISPGIRSRYQQGETK